MQNPRQQILYLRFFVSRKVTTKGVEGNFSQRNIRVLCVIIHDKKKI